MSVTIKQLSRATNYQRSEHSGLFRGLRVVGLLGLALFASVGLTVGPASAGCGLNVTFHNDIGISITVLNVESKTSTGKWKTVHSKKFTVPNNVALTKAIETDASCLFPHHLRVKYTTSEKDSLLKGSGYKTKGPLATAVDKKYTFEFDD